MSTKSVALILAALFCPVASIAQSLLGFANPGARSAALGHAALASLHDPAAVFWNPAALSLARDARFRISTNQPFNFDYIGVSQFWPRFGDLAASISRYDFLLPDSTGELKIPGLLERGTLAYARDLSRHFAVGTAVDYNRNKTSETEFFTFALGIQIYPFEAGQGDSRAALNRLDTFNPVELPHRFSLALVARDLPLGRSELDPHYEAGVYYLPLPRGPSFHLAFRFDKNDNSFRLGISQPILNSVHLNAGIEDFNVDRAAFGVSLLSTLYSIDVGYSLRTESIVADFSVRLGATPASRAQRHQARSIALAREGSYREALREIEKNLHYLPDDSISRAIRGTLINRIDAREREIMRVLEQARSDEERKLYIWAAKKYLQVLQDHPEHRVAKDRLQHMAPMLESQITQLYDAGIRMYEEQEYASADVAFRTILDVQKSHRGAQVYLERVRDAYSNKSQEAYFRGLGFYRQKKYEQAIDALKEAIAFHSQNREARDLLAEANAALQTREQRVRTLMRIAQEHARNRDFLQALDAYNQIVAIHPDNIDARSQVRALEVQASNQLNNLTRQAVSAFEAGNFAQARNQFQKLQRYETTQRTASQYLDRIRDVDRRRIEDVYNEAIRHYDSREFDRAITLLDSVLAMENNYKQAYEKKQDALEQLSFSEALAKAEAKFNAANHRATLAFEDAMRLKDALTYYEQLLTREPKNQLVESRVQECRRRLRFFNEDTFNRAVSLYAAENYSEASARLKQVLAIDPDHLQAMEYLNKSEQRRQAVEALK